MKGEINIEETAENKFKEGYESLMRFAMIVEISQRVCNQLAKRDQIRKHTVMAARRSGKAGWGHEPGVHGGSFSVHLDTEWFAPDRFKNPLTVDDSRYGKIKKIAKWAKEGLFDIRSLFINSDQIPDGWATATWYKMINYGKILPIRNNDR